MPKYDCPYCEDAFTTREEFDFHALKKHPEKTMLADFQEAKIARLWSTASVLTDITIARSKKTPTKEDALKLFRYFLGEIMKSEGDK